MDKKDTSLELNLLLPILEEMGVTFKDLTQALIEKYGVHGEEYYIEKIKKSIKYDKENKGNTIEILMEEIYMEIENKQNLNPTIIKYVKEELAKDNDPSYQEKVALKKELEELKAKMLNVSGKQYETLRTRLIEVQMKLDAKKEVGINLSEELRDLIELSDEAFKNIEDEINQGFEKVIEGLEIEEDLKKDLKKVKGIQP
jgi:hypothetical protein